VTAKDLVLAVIAHIGAAGGVGHVIEYAGSAIRGLSIEGRLTVCNMTIEAGARAGMVAPDDTTYAYLHGPPARALGQGLGRRACRLACAAQRRRRTLRSRGDDRRDAQIAPMVTWGTSPEDAVAIDDRVPDPASDAPDAAKRDAMRVSLDYMGLAPGTRIEDIAVDRVFIGSCTNSRIEDLRAAAAVVHGRTAVCRPGSCPAPDW
jgi:3-isopropylmalate/(R)-2-methylmalate dehydratase large subunit